MVAAYQDSEPTNLREYLSAPVESPVDDAPDEGSLPETDGLHTEQSSADSEQVAPDADTEQPEGSDTITEELDGDSSPTEPVSAGIDWDSPDNPHFQAAQALRQLADDAQRKQREADEAALMERRVGVMKRLASGEIDDDDIPIITGEFVSEIQQSAIAPYANQVQTYEHGMTALVAAVNMLPPEQKAYVEAQARELRELGRTSQEIESVFHAGQKFKSTQDKENAALKTQIKNLTAQLAAKTIQDSGANRTESVTLGAGADEPNSMREYLAGPM